MKSVGHSIPTFLALACVFALAGDCTASVVINEVELNPRAESPLWIELFNSGDNNVSIGGWTIELFDGPWKPSIPIPQNTILPAGGFFVASGEPTWDEHTNATAVLLNDSGLEMDRTAALTDERDNDFTNSRIQDGRDTDSNGDWVFMLASKGLPNGGPARS